MTAIMLTRTEEEVLARAMQSGCARSRDRLIVAHLPLARAYARRFAKHYDFDDLYQESVIGLMRAAEAFDLSRGVRFSTCAYIYMRNQLCEFCCRNISQVERRTYSQARAAMLKDLREGVFVYDRPLNAKVLINHGEEVGEWGDKLPDPSPLPDALAELSRDGARRMKTLKELLGTLSERERLIIRARWPDEAESIVPGEVLANHFGITRERIRQIEDAALTKLGAEGLEHGAGARPKMKRTERRERQRVAA